jgi:hypothetical protein
MSGVQPDSIDEIISVLSVSMAAVLGDYAFVDPRGQTQSVKAIWPVKNIDLDPPNEFEKTGIECLIFPADPDSSPYFARNAKITLDWQIRLIQHDRMADLVAAHLAVVSAYPNVRKQSHLSQSIERDEQINLLLTATKNYG